MSDARADAVLPTASALVGAVARRDADRIALILSGDIDWPALAVVLADQAGRGPSARYVANVLADLAAAPKAEKTIARRYGITEAAVRAIRKANAPDAESDEVLTSGHWERHGLIQVWVSNEREVA